MARGFNLTAEINLRGPSNIRTVVADIRRQLGTVTANVDIRINPAAGRTINTLNQSLQRLNTSLQATRTLSNQAVSALNSLASVGSRVSSTISTLPRNIQSASTAVNTLTRNTNNATQATQQARTEFEEFGRQSALAVRRFAAFALGTSAIVKLNNAIASGVREFIAFDRELVRVSQVTGTSVKNLDSLVGKITSLSTSLGVTSEDLISVSSTLAQAGLSARDTEKALKALALSALAPSFDSLQDTVEGSIALMRQFGISAGDLEKALGSVNAVAAKFAVESSDIITAIQRTGGVFAAASRGVSEGTDALNQFIAVFTSVRATTRESAETIATGLRTIFTRIQRGDTIDALKQYGVTLTDLEGKFVGPYEAVRRLAEGLNQLDPRDLRFARIVEELGGFRQIGKVIPLIQQFTTAQQALIVAQRGQGSLATDAAIAQQALANKISKVREEFVALIRSVSQSQSFQNFVDLSLSLASGLIRVADAAKSVLPALTAITAIRGASFLTQFATGFYGGMRRANPPRGMATGGMVPGQGNRDTVPAMLTPGEFVIRKRAVEKIGVNKLARLNKGNGGSVQYFNNGGLVQRFAGGKGVKKSKGNDKVQLPGSGPTEFTHIAARIAPKNFSPQLQKYLKSQNLNVSGLYTNMGLDLPATWNRNWAQPKDGQGAFAQNLANYIQSKDVFKTLKSGSNKRWRFTGRGDSIAQELLVKSADDIKAQLANRVRGVSKFFDIDPEVSNILPRLLRESIYSVLSRADARNLMRGFKEKSAYKTGALRKPLTKEIRQNLKNRGGFIQRFMAGGIAESILQKVPTLDDLVSGPFPANMTFQPGQESWGDTVENIMRSMGISYDSKNKKLKLNTETGMMDVGLRDALSPRNLSAALFKRKYGDSNVAKLNNVRTQIVQAFSGKKSGLLEEKRDRTGEEVQAAQMKGLLFGAVGMLGAEYRNKPLRISKGLTSPVDVVTSGYRLDEVVGKEIDSELSRSLDKSTRRSARKIMIGQIIKDVTGGNFLSLDFDRTLAMGADRILANPKDPRYAEFGDREKVGKALSGARLSVLGRSLVSLVSSAGPENRKQLLDRMKVITARPQSTMDLVQSWLQSKGLPIPLSQFTGLGGPSVTGDQIAKLKSGLLSPGSSFVDDDERNIEEASKAGAKSYLYNFKRKKESRDIPTAKGVQFQDMIRYLGGPDANPNKKSIDFPSGVGAAAKYFNGIPPNIPTDAKRTITSPSDLTDNIKNYLISTGVAKKTPKPVMKAIGGFIQRFANAGPVEEYYGQAEVEATRKAWRKFKSSVKKAFDSDKVYFETDMAKSIAAGADPEVYGTGIGKLAKGEPGVIGPKKIRLAKERSGAATDPREAAKRKAIRKQDQLAAIALKGLLGGLPEDKQREVASLFGLRSGIGPSLMPSLGGGGANAAEELTAAKQGVSALKKTGQLNVSKQFVDFFRSNLASYYLELKQAAMLDPSDPDLKKQLKKTRRAGVDIRKSLRTNEPIGVQGRRTAASETLSLMLKERFKGFADGGSSQDTVPALLTPGEFVINRKAAQRIGASRLNTLNRADRIKGFNKGGAVGYIQKLAGGGKPEKLAEAVSSFDPVSPDALRSLDTAVDNLLAKIVDKIAKADPSVSFDDAYAQAQRSKEAQSVTPTASFGLMRQAETGDQQAANMVADAQRKQVNSIVKVIRANDSSIPISQAKAAAERRVADAWGGLYKRTKEQEQQASLLSRAMSRVTGLYSRIRGSDLTPEQREAKEAFNNKLSNLGMGLAFTAPMIADQIGQSMGGTTGQGVAAATSTASTYVAIGTQIAPLLGPAGPLALLATGLLGAVAAVDDFYRGIQKAEIELNKLKIEKEGQKAEKSLAQLAKDPKNAAATQELINSLDAMSASETAIQKSNKELRKPTTMGRLGSFLTGGYYDSTTPTEVKENKEYQDELKKLNEQNLNAAEFEARQRELVGKYTAKVVGEANAAQSRARADIAMQALSSKGSQGLTIDQALSSFGGNAGKIQESIAAGNQEYAIELQKLTQAAEAGTISSAELDKRKKSLIQKYFLQETETLKAAMADNARAKAATKVAKALNTAVTSIERTFGNMEAALNRGADALSQATSRLDAMAADRSNLQNTFAGQNVLENPRAYSRAERTRAVQQTAGFFGGDAKFVEKLTSTVGSDIKDSLTAIGVRAQANPGTSKEVVAQEVQRTVDQQLMAAFGNNDLTRQLSEQIRIQLEEQVQNKDTKEIDVDQLIATSTGLTSLIDSEKKAFELLAQASKQATQALDLYSSKLVTATEMLNEVDNINAESISMRASNDFRLREMLGQGQKVPVGERIAARTREAAARAGIKPDQLNTAALVARLDSLRQSRTTMEQNRATFQEGRSFSDPATMEGINKFNAGLINLDNEIAKTKNALKNLPKDIQGAIDDVAAAMEDRLSKIEAKREAGAGLAERLTTSTPTELMGLSSTYNILNNALNGQARTIQQSTAAQMAYQKIIQDGGTAVEAMTAAQAAYADENKQVFGLFNELVAVGGIDKQQANTMRADLLETMARSQGMNMQNNPLFNQIIANLRRKPEEDPEIARLKTLYEQLQETQQKAAEATRQLVIDDATNLIKAAGSEVKKAIETARISFNEQQLNDVGLGLSRPGQVMGKQDGGLIYASKGKFINFQPKGTDTVPAMLTPGEFVVNARATQQNLPLLQAINKSSGGPVQYFAAGTKKPVSMSRNAPNQITNMQQARSFYDDIMNAWGVPAGGSITPNPAKKPQATTQTQAAVAPKPAVSSTPSGSMYTVNPDTGGVSRPFMSGGIDYASLSPDDLLLEQKYLKQQLNLLKGPDGKITGFAVNEAKKLIATIQQINAYLPPDMRPAVTTAQAPAAAAANTAATPKPATQAASKPAKQTTAKPKATTAASKPTPTNFVYDPDNLLPDAPSASDAKDVIAKRGPLMDYDSIQPDAGGAMRTVKPGAARGGFGFGRFRLPSIGGFSGAGRLAMRAGSAAVGGVRAIGTSLIPALGINAASEFLGFGSLSNEAITAGSIGFDALRGGLRAAYTAPSGFNAFAGPGGSFGGRIPTQALSNQAGRLTTANRFLPRVGNNFLNTRIPGTPNLPRFGGGAGIPSGSTAGRLATGIRGAAAPAIAVNTALSAITEGASFLYDREGYSNRLAAEEENEYANSNFRGLSDYMSGSGLRYAGGQALSGFTNPFRMFAKFGRAAYSTSQATANNQAQQQQYDARTAEQRQDWSMGGRMQILQTGAQAGFADVRNNVILDTATGQKFNLNDPKDKARFDKIVSSDRLAGFGLTGIERGWVRAKAELEEQKARGDFKNDPAEYEKRNADLEARRSAKTTRYTRGYLWNTETEENVMSSTNLDSAVGAERAARQEERDRAAREAENRRIAQAQQLAQRFAQWVDNAVQTGSDVVSGVQSGAQNLWNYGQRMWTTMQKNAEAKREADNIKRLYTDASTAMARPSMPDYIDKFKELADRRSQLEKEYLDAGRLVDPEQRKEEQARIRREIEGINSTVVKQQREGYSTPEEQRKKAWDAHNKAQAAAVAKQERDAILAEKREINDAEKRRLAADKALDKISRVPAPRDPERVPEWRAKTLEKIRDKFNLSGNTEEDIKLMTAYGLSPELAKNLFRPLTEQQNQAAYEILSQQTQRGQYKYSDSDLNLLKMSREELIKKIASGRMPQAEAMLARKEKLETAREKEFGKAIKAMGRIDSLAQKGMAANPPAQRRFRGMLLKRLIKLGYVDPRESDAANAQRLSAFNLNANTVSFVYPAQVGGMLAGKVDDAQQKHTGGIVYASKGKLINFQPRGSDTVPAMLTPGEFVVNARATQQNLPLLQAINKAKGGQVSYFNTGGVPAANMSIGPAQSSNIRAQQQSLALQQKAAENINAVGVGVQNTNKIATNINNQQLPSLTNKADNYQESNTQGISNLNYLSNQNLTRTGNVGKYLDVNNFPGRFDYLEENDVLLENQIQNATNKILQAEQNIRNDISTSTMDIIASVVDPDLIAGGVALAGQGAAGRMANAQLSAIGRFNRGGMVYASKGMMIPYQPRGTDTVPAMLTPGEFVVNRSATKANLPLLQAINGGAKGFSSGGQVNYMADGGLLGQLFAPLMGSFKGLTSSIGLAIQALQTYQKQLAATQPNSVSNTSGPRMNLDGLSEFTNKFDQFITALNGINIPPMVNLQVAPVTVNITGAEALVAALEGPLGGMLQQQIAVAMNRLSANSEGAIQA
jgi:TP901 family phage tail tape measure protein